MDVKAKTNVEIMQEELRGKLQSSGTRAILITVEGNQCRYNYINMGAGEAADHLTTIRSDVLKKFAQ